MKPKKSAHSLAIAKIALQRIEQHELSADPNSFELWYNYASGRNPDLNKAVDALVASAGGLTSADVDRLYDQHRSSIGQSTRGIGTLATDLSDEIAQAIGMMEAAAASSESYEKCLTEGLLVIERTERRQTVRTVVEALVQATREMDRKTRDLELRLDELRTRIIHLQKDVEVLRLETQTDSLTLIGNRPYFDGSLAKSIQAANASGEPVSLLFVDIDHFKSFNDKFGHLVGDQVLRIVASVIKAQLRDSDIAARYGGEEFAIILPGVPRSMGKLTAERLRTTIMARELKNRGTEELLGRITVSIGVAQFRRGETAQELVQRADACLYSAKRTGRNRVVSEHDRESISEGRGAA